MVPFARHSGVPRWCHRLNLGRATHPSTGRSALMVIVDQPVDLAKWLVHTRLMTEVGVHEAKTELSRLLRAVEAGEEVVIMRGGEPVARLTGFRRAVPQLGIDRGRFEVPEDFDAPLPDEFLDAFER